VAPFSSPLSQGAAHAASFTCRDCKTGTLTSVDDDDVTITVECDEWT
jgi:hypothetical protein